MDPPEGPTVSWYTTYVRCAECGKLHRVASEMHLASGPTRAGTAAELYADRRLSLVAAELRRQEWLGKQAGESVLIDHPARAILPPGGQR